MSFVEIHFHLLPGVDDGPRSLDESVELAAAAAAEGTRTIVATPHVQPCWVTDVGVLGELVSQVSAALGSQQIPVRVLCGAELGHVMVGRLSQRELELIAQGPPGKRWLLLEAPLAGFDDGFILAADELRDRGFGVVVAHPERALSASPAGWQLIEHELASGSPMQLNAWSLAGRYDERVRASALRLLRASPRVVIASDAHGRARMPSLRLALDVLAAAGEADPRRLAGVLPRSLLERGVTVPATVDAA